MRPGHGDRRDATDDEQATRSANRATATPRHVAQANRRAARCDSHDGRESALAPWRCPTLPAQPESSVTKSKSTKRSTPTKAAGNKLVRPSQISLLTRAINAVTMAHNAMMAKVEYLATSVARLASTVARFDARLRQLEPPPPHSANPPQSDDAAAVRVAALTAQIVGQDRSPLGRTLPSQIVDAAEKLAVENAQLIAKVRRELQAANAELERSRDRAMFGTPASYDDYWREADSHGHVVLVSPGLTEAWKSFVRGNRAGSLVEAFGSAIADPAGWLNDALKLPLDTPWPNALDRCRALVKAVAERDALTAQSAMLGRRVAEQDAELELFREQVHKARRMLGDPRTIVSVGTSDPPQLIPAVRSGNSDHAQPDQ